MTPERESRITAVAGARQAGFVVVLEDIHDPHNAAAIMRTCDAFGIQHLGLVFEKEKPFNPRQVGKVSSSSANRWLSFKKFGSSKECLDELKAEEFIILATTLHGGAKDPYTTDLAFEKVALVIGNEHRGVSDVFIEGADMLLTLPMHGFVESLNVSVAAALCIAEIRRQRGDKPLSDEKRGDLVRLWKKEK